MKLEIILAIIAMLFISGCGIGAVMDENGNRIAINEFFKSSTVTKETKLVSKLTGSIYETGDMITVFGTCLTGDDQPIDTDVNLRVFYPNGILFINTTNMTHFETGYWYWTGVMEAIQGTYLTEFVCSLDGQQAISYGEWQNPIWVNRLAVIDNTTQDIKAQLNNLSMNVTLICPDGTSICDKLSQLMNLTNTSFNITISGIEQLLNMTNQLLAYAAQFDQDFNITFSKLDNINTTILQEFNTTNTLINNLNISGSVGYSICVANRSVDRNDSYLAGIIQNVARSVKAPITYGLTIVNAATFPYKHSRWSVKTYVEDEYGYWGRYDNGIRCNITTDNSGVNITASMDWVGSDHCLGIYDWPHCTNDMESNGFFYYEQMITTDDFDYSTACYYEGRATYDYPPC
jgi:hypothetical protein